MPIYEYRCEHCGQTVEKIQRKPVAQVPCPACGKIATRSVSLTSAASSSGGGTCSAPAGSGFT
ncbi:putative regulatory protein, FmdB family [Desulfuromusa kysingii]|uniref:Putative regulatory protein, FmdB family n=1 Tax=Desulfuromusa kysingii TaxID=37625 RepID=A0A1H4BXH4_9BACT|nr:zinc ribbon domain-containing protein [Desulfuromusa kysingii]SEA52905.1 putative regulatory protein, FmdB family [Desulfuromusa kysingii]